MSSNMIGELMRRAQEMQEKMKEFQKEAAGKVVEASSGGGMITVRINGKQELLSIRIEPDVIEGDDTEMLQDLIVAAVNEGVRKSKSMMEEELKKMTGGLNINLPGLF